MSSSAEAGVVDLRPTAPDDILALFRMESDPDARHMSAFGNPEMSSFPEYRARWERMIADEGTVTRTVMWNGQVAGYVLEFLLFKKPSVGYWIDKELWGRGIATRALSAFLLIVRIRPLFARVAKDNLGSRKVLERCGFSIVGEDKGFAPFRGKDVEEFIYQLG
jgi:RimJ/RimL family protein N-acetyltransferase